MSRQLSLVLLAFNLTEKGRKKGIVKTSIIFLILIILPLSSIFSIALAKEDISHETLDLQLVQSFLGVDSRVVGHLQTGYFAPQYQGYLGMVAPGETIVTLPGIAENWTHNDDRTEWTFTLREGVTFHDGTGIDAKTVKYSVEANYMADKAYGKTYINISHAARLLIENEGMSITFPSDDPNGNGRIVTFSGSWFPDPMFEWDVCGMWHRFMLVPYESHGSYTDDNTTCKAKLESFSQEPISAGPYKFAKWLKDEYVLLERFDDWFGWGKSFSASNGEVYSFPSMDNAFKFLNYSHVSDNTLAVNQLVSGKLDIVTELDATPEVRQKINSHNNISFSTVEILGGDYISMNIQGDYPEYFGGPGNFPLSQVWFRQAVSHAINRTHLENVAYNNYGYPLQARTTWFPDWIENDSPDLDTTDYYDFYQGKEKASSLLHEAGYRPLTFSEEPTNRFGWGVYANETQVGGVEQVRGRHFKLLCSSNLEYSVKRAEAIKNDLEQVGIFVEIDASPDWRTYLASLYSGDPGGSYNTTGGQPDPNFTGPEWDFAVVAAVALPYDTPAAYCATIQFAWWYYGWWSGENSWCNENYEINRAKIFGGEPGLGQLGIPPPADMPPSGYSPPVWENDDTQYIEACEQAGFEMSKELPYAPLTNYRHVYAINNHVKNFQMNGAYMFIIAYSYWSTEDGGSSTGVYGALTIMIIVLFLLTIPPQHNKKRKRGS